MGYSVTRAAHPEFADLEEVTLVSPDDFSATFVPGAGMVGSSILHRGEQLLGMRGGLGPYRESGKTFGIPILAPWANRLKVKVFDGIELVTDGTPRVRLDENGLPIHGLLWGCPDWRVTRCEAIDDSDQQGAWLAAELDFSSSRPEFPAFPFEHKLGVEVHVRATSVEISTTLTATGERRVPIAFGWHPYFAPPGGERHDWAMAKPFTRHVELDAQNIPTGVVVRVPVTIDILGDPARGGKTYDDLFCEVPPRTKAWVEGGSRRITVRYDSGYPYALLFAPPDQALVAIEPMTAPTDPLAGHFLVRTAQPGEKYTAVFSIHVTPSGVDA